MKKSLLLNKGFKLLPITGRDGLWAVGFLGVTTPTVAQGLRFDGLIRSRLLPSV